MTAFSHSTPSTEHGDHAPGPRLSVGVLACTRTSEPRDADLQAEGESG